jgi:hypothetical protein
VRRWRSVQLRIDLSRMQKLSFDLRAVAATSGFGLIVAGIAVAWTARAQQLVEQQQPLVVATGEPEPSPEPWRPPPSRRWHDGAAFGLSFGTVWVENARRGYYGRFDIGGYEIQTRRRGMIWGSLLGLEGWGARSSDDSLDKGGSLPLVIYAGLQSDAFFSRLGAGFDVLLVDRIDHDTGVGFFAPLADASLGLDLEGVRFLLNARPGYRWQLGAPDRGVIRVGLSVELTTD